MNTCSFIDLFCSAIYKSLDLLTLSILLDEKGRCRKMSFPGGVNSAACIMWSRVKNMIASFGRREMQKCKIGKKGGRRELFHYKI